MELVMGTFISAPHITQAAARLSAIRAHPQVAITIDTEGFPPSVLLIRGAAAITEVDGTLPEYAGARRYLANERAAVHLAQIDQPGTKMARIAVRPTWAGILDFQTRFPDGVRQSSGIRLFRRGRGTAGTSISGGNRVGTLSLGVLRFDETALLLNVSMQRGAIAPR